MRGATADRTQLSIGRLVSYRLDVVGSDISDVVRCTGGWLFDRVMAGWEVNVLITGPCELRALQILGVTALSLDTELAAMKKGAPTRALAVSADVLRTNDQVRDKVTMALGRGITEVTLWGDLWSAEFDRRVEQVEHRLSAAARAFKAHALVAAAISDPPVGSTEVFHSAARWYPPNSCGLVPVS